MIVAVWFIYLESSGTLHSMNLLAEWYHKKKFHVSWLIPNLPLEQSLIPSVYFFLLLLAIAIISSTKEWHLASWITVFREKSYNKSTYKLSSLSSFISCLSKTIYCQSLKDSLYLRNYLRILLSLLLVLLFSH